MSPMRVCAALLVLATACARKESDTPNTVGATASAPASDRAATTAAVSNAIAANPAAADSILQANGFTREEFQRVMYEIASDSAQSAAYAAAKGR